MVYAHKPVLFHKSIEYLTPKPGGVFIDATVGGGGHAEGICGLIGPEGILLGIDRDPEALEETKRRLSRFPCRVDTAQGNFKDIVNLARNAGLEEVDGALFDLGFSSYQVDLSSRGFSYQKDVFLDMRMDPGEKETAADLLHNLSAEELAHIIKKYGEEKWAERIAEFIVNERRHERIERSSQLVDIIKKAIPARARRRGPHPARRTFQALRIAVNDELQSLEKALNSVIDILKVGGRICVISYHSLEDRIVKKIFHDESQKCTCPPELPICSCDANPRLYLPVRKVITPSEAEVRNNPRARSARLRVAQKIRR